MAIKLALALTVVAFIIAVAIVATFWYLKESKEMQHEKEMERIERDEKLFDSEFGQQDSIDRELEREKE